MLRPSKITGCFISRFILREVRLAELVPLGDDEQRVGALQRVVGVLGVVDLAALKIRCATVARFGIERAHLGAALEQALDDRNRRRLAHVVGARLEREPPHGDRLALERFLP